MEQENYEKIITINDESFETIRHSIDKLIFFMFKQNSNPNVAYFRLRLKDSEKCPFAKDLKLEWSCFKQPERLSPEDVKQSNWVLPNGYEIGMELKSELDISDSPTPADK